MDFKAVPISMISTPNTFVELTKWEITDQGAPQTLWFRLDQIDAISQRRYVPAVGSSFAIIFQRADQFQLDGVRLNKLQSQTQTVQKVGNPDANDRSLVQINMTAADIKMAMSGTVKFALTESGVTYTWNQNFLFRKLLTDAGM